MPCKQRERQEAYPDLDQFLVADAAATDQTLSPRPHWTQSVSIDLKLCPLKPSRWVLAWVESPSPYLAALLKLGLDESGQAEAVEPLVACRHQSESW